MRSQSVCRALPIFTIRRPSLKMATPIGPLVPVAARAISTGWPARLDLLQMTFSGGWPVLSRNFSVKSDSNARVNGTYRITPAHSGKSLDVENCGVSAGTNLRQWSWINNNCQKFIITRVDDVWHRISPVSASGLAFDVDSYSTADGANVNQWQCLANATNQMFSLQAQ